MNISMPKADNPQPLPPLSSGSQDTNSQTFTHLVRSRLLSRLPDQPRRKNIQTLILRVYQQTVHSDHSTVKLKEDPHAQFPIGFLDPTFLINDYLVYVRKNASKNRKMQLSISLRLYRERKHPQNHHYTQRNKRGYSNPEARAACFTKETYFTKGTFKV